MVYWFPSPSPSLTRLDLLSILDFLSWRTKKNGVTHTHTGWPFVFFLFLFLFISFSFIRTKKKENFDLERAIGRTDRKIFLDVLLFWIFFLDFGFLMIGFPVLTTDKIMMTTRISPYRVYRVFFVFLKSGRSFGFLVQGCQFYRVLLGFVLWYESWRSRSRLTGFYRVLNLARRFPGPR